MSEEKLYNFYDTPEVQEALKKKCKEMGISKSELFREYSRRVLAGDLPESMSREEQLARASTLEEEAAEKDAEAEKAEETAARLRSEAESLRQDAADLRERAEEVEPFDDLIDDLAEEMLTSEMRLFTGHKKVSDVASEHGVAEDEVLDAVQEATNLPDYRFIKGGQPGDSR